MSSLIPSFLRFSSRYHQTLIHSNISSTESHIYSPKAGTFQTPHPPPPYVLTGRGGSKTVNELWSRMGYPEDHVLHEKSKMAAERLIFTCRAPLIHPWLSLKSLKLLGVPRTSPSTSTRNKVVYMSRSHGGAANPGRRVVNEEAVLRGITAFLDERDNGEELVMFNPDNFQNITQLFAWFSENVIAVVGPHGGAMINHRWANRDILVIEFMPADRIAMMNYEEALLLSQTYAAIIVEPIGLDMEIDRRGCCLVAAATSGGRGRGSSAKQLYMAI
ncbi:hypothetical protein B0H14DRAFT_304211 [Mycena olivaceomarginata]|nr:hypothetical protein B0H14DRAFT_304211 [Mycena olivaceomarginata]